MVEKGSGMTKLKRDTEDKILNCARLIFQEKGFDGARMQEIADQAKINKAALHYYYRSKEKLFQRVFKDTVSDLIAFFEDAFENDLSIDELIINIIHKYMDFLQNNSNILFFVMSELRKNRDLVQPIMSEVIQSGWPARLTNRFQEEVEAGRFREFDQRQLIMNILSLSAFPIIAEPLFTRMFAIGSVEYKDILAERKNLIPELILHGIKT